MKGIACKYGTILAVVCGVTGPVLAGDADVTDNDRAFRNFTREAATVGAGQLRLEVRGFILEDDENTELDLLGFPACEIEQRQDAEVTRVQGGIIDLLVSYGLGENTEIGANVPFFIQKTRLTDSPSITDEDVGDVIFYTKFKHHTAENCAVGVGLELAVPTGVEKKRFGTGEVGFNTFLSSRYQHGRFAVGGHVGYQIYTGTPADVFNYSVTALVRGTSRYAIRTEVSGRYFKAFGQEFSDIVVMPGFDLNLADNITVRPTGLANLTDEAIDWGIGIGIALTL